MSEEKRVTVRIYASQVVRYDQTVEVSEREARILLDPDSDQDEFEAMAGACIDVRNVYDADEFEDIEVVRA